MLNPFKSKKRPQLFLHSITVIPRDDMKITDEKGFWNSSDYEKTLRTKLTEFFDIPVAPDDHEPTSTDLGLEITIPHYQGANLTTGDILPLYFWRPKLEIVARLFYLKSGKNKATIRVKHKLPWKQYSNKLDFKVLIRYKPLFDDKDIELLLYQALQKLLKELSKII